MNPTRLIPLFRPRSLYFRPDIISASRAGKTCVDSTGNQNFDERPSVEVGLFRERVLSNRLAFGATQPER
jgi:hypothetical protein